MTTYTHHPDLRPALASKGLKTFHLATDDEEAACYTELDARAYATTVRHATRRGLTLCPKCADLEVVALEPDEPTIGTDPDPDEEPLEPQDDDGEPTE